MSIADELQNYNDGLLEAYDAVDAKGGTIPANKNLDNLPTAIGTISGGGGGYDPTDPEQVYRVTRPADWLVMPEIGENEDNVFYLLLQVGKDTVDFLPTRVYVQTSDSSTVTTIEFGATDAQGNFTADSALTTTRTGSGGLSQELPPTSFGNVTSSGLKQIICKISSNGGLVRLIVGGAGNGSIGIPGAKMRHSVIEFKGKGTTLTALGIGNDSDTKSSWNMAYFALLGENGISSGFESMFENCFSLMAVLGLDTSSGTSFSKMFANCYSLVAIPQLDTSSGINFSQMFHNCSSLTTIPQLDTSAGTNFSSMFLSCSSLTTIPQLDTSSGTNFMGMFSRCYSLTLVPDLNTSLGTNFSAMFYSCVSLLAAPSLNTSSGTEFTSMYQSCRSLTEADFSGYDFSSVTSATALNDLAGSLGGGITLVFGDVFASGGIINTGTIVSTTGLADFTYPVRVKINKTDAMLQISTNASTLFLGGDVVYVYVPDALLATYQADAYWNTLGTRLKGFSELPS